MCCCELFSILLLTSIYPLDIIDSRVKGKQPEIKTMTNPIETRTNKVTGSKVELFQTGKSFKTVITYIDKAFKARFGAYDTKTTSHTGHEQALKFLTKRGF